MTKTIVGLLIALAVGLSLSACGTKGGLDCPPGTTEREDGTCIPVRSP